MNKPQSTDLIWQKIVDETTIAIKQEPILQQFLQSTVLDHSSMGESLSYHLANKLANHALPFETLRPLMQKAFADKQILSATAKDIQATVDRDSACSVFSTPFLYFKGFWHYRLIELPIHFGSRAINL